MQEGVQELFYLPTFKNTRICFDVDVLMFDFVSKRDSANNSDFLILTLCRQQDIQ